MAASKLAKYQGMRDFSQTAEPSGRDAKVAASKALRFVIQKHAASHLHFDLRLEYEGTFRSWAVPKGPSLDPKDRRMAMEVEDHPPRLRRLRRHDPQGPVRRRHGDAVGPGLLGA